MQIPIVNQKVCDHGFLCFPQYHLTSQLVKPFLTTLIIMIYVFHLRG